MKNIQINSQYIREGDIFLGISCENLKNNVFTALRNGASLVFVEEQHKEVFAHINNIIFVADCRLIASKLAAFCHSSYPKNCVAVTGTNGKSSVVHFLRQIWHHLGERAANLGTLGLYVDDEKVIPDGLNVPALTTPDAISLHKILSYLSDKNITHFAFEASSHALDQKRLHSVRLKAAAFTNLASDHMDYHKTRLCYLESKLKLFSEVLEPENMAVVPLDFPEIYTSVKKIHQNIITFGLSEKNFIRAANIIELPNKLTFDLTIGNKIFRNVETNLFGNFQVLNILCAISLAYACGADTDNVAQTLGKITQLEGRMEYICSYNGASIYVDYAHTAEGFKNCLETFRRNCKGRLVCIFGCGGDRDKSKRRENGRIAEELADLVVVTDDNPRTEDPASIRREIISSCKKAMEIGDRKTAIEFGIKELSEGDVLVIIGKGHETTQIYKDKTIPHNDKEEVLKVVCK